MQADAPPPFDDAAFERLYAETSGATLALARRICRDAADAEDACQLAYLAVFRYWTAGKLTEAPRRLLFRVAQRAAIDAVRTRTRRQRVDGLATQGSDSARGWGELELRDAVDRLQNSQRVAILLRAEGSSYQELSRALHQSVPAIRSRLSRARRTLIDTLGDATRQSVRAPRTAARRAVASGLPPERSRSDRDVRH